jgi:hypothetical protein
MQQFLRAVVLVLILVVYSSARAQQPDAAAASSSQSAATQNEESRRSADDALLVRAAKLYYSTKSVGLSGFDCTVHPDWVKLIESMETQGTVTEGNVLLLKSTGISLHARMNGGSRLEWIQPSNASKPLDQASAATIDQIHKAIEEALMNFMQFWTPIVDGSMVPLSSANIDIRHSPTGMVLLLRQPDALVMEIFSNDLVIKEFKLVTGGKMIDLVPTYDSADEDLLVSHFVAHTGPATVSATNIQETDAEIVYQTIEGFPIPSMLNVEVVGTGTFNFKLDGCRVNRMP